MMKITDTKKQILDVSLELIKKYSIGGFSFQDVAKIVGIKKGSLYYHFESKDELVVAILERARDELRESFARGTGKTPTERLMYFVNIFRKFIAPAHKMCPGGVSASDWGKLSPEVKRAVKKMYFAQVEGIQEIIEAGRATGEFRTNSKSAHTMAVWIISSVQGSLVTSRIMGDPEPFEQAVELAMDCLKAP